MPTYLPQIPRKKLETHALPFTVSNYAYTPDCAQNGCICRRMPLSTGAATGGCAGTRAWPGGAAD